MDTQVEVMHPELIELPVQELTVVIPAARAMEVFTKPGAIQPWIDFVRKEIDGFTPDLSTARGRRDIASFAFKVTKSKTYLDGVGKELVAELKDIPKKIDATRKLVRDTLDGWADEVRKPLTDWETADEARVAKHREAIAIYTGYSQPTPETPLATMRADLAGLEAVPLDEAACEEFLSEYKRVRDASVLILKTLIPLREKAEADAAELIQLRADKAARDERDRFEAELLEKAAAEKAMAEAAAARKIEQDRADAETAAQLARDVTARIAREAEEAQAREAAAIAQREADEAHVEAVNQEAIRALMGAGISELDAISVVALIAGGDVPHVHITY